MINERLITCINLFNGCNDVEEFLNKMIKIVKEIEALTEEEQTKITSDTYRDNFTKEEKESVWYKIFEEITSASRTSSDTFQKMIISLSALFISLH